MQVDKPRAAVVSSPGSGVPPHLFSQVTDSRLLPSHWTRCLTMKTFKYLFENDPPCVATFPSNFHSIPPSPHGQFKLYVMSLLLTVQYQQDSH